MSSRLSHDQQLTREAVLVSESEDLKGAEDYSRRRGLDVRYCRR
jgi:hypothetical protein